MKFQKVVWYEGMKLDPHHFQQADKYSQYYTNSRINTQNPNSWGLKELQFDDAAISGGSFGLVRCSGVMPDGLLFDMPGNDPLPKNRNFDSLFSATSEKLDVFLVIPSEVAGGNNCLLDESASNNNSRFTLQNFEMLDFNTGTNLRNVGVVKSNFQFRFGDENLEGFSSIKIGELARSSDGKFTMNREYIVSSVSISASEVLLDHIRGILSALVSKSKELRTQASINKPELSITQVEILMMLHSINTFIPLLNYYYSSKHEHPESLYTIFLNLAGQLSTFTNLGLKAEDFPVYDHRHLTEIFNQMILEINGMLNVQKTVERKDIIITLRRQADTLFVGQLSPNHVQAQFFIAVKGDIPEKKIITELPKNIKISAYEEIFAVHQAGIQGLTIEYIARPPAGVSIDDKAHYFKINKEGRFWEKIVGKNNVAFFIASEFKSLQMELVLLP
ncbi:MAG: type VI secretion system baseplate subunit TssK [Ignavibacteriales bacterium]|nr:MAG: type VI secretion system baseplate subunit TssK [Ignavibacteriales bacterium]